MKCSAGLRWLSPAAPAISFVTRLAASHTCPKSSRPRVGGDDIIVGLNRDGIKFQFTPPRGGRRVYWILKNTGAMDDKDLAQFVQRMKIVKATMVDGSDATAAEAHTLDVPVEARKTMLDILRRDLYEDAQMLDVSALSAAAKTATEITAAYQPQDNKCADFEYFLIDFIRQICAVAGIENPEPAFTWNKIINQAEITSMVLSAAEFLDDETTLRHLPWLLPEEVPEILKRRDEADLKRMGALQAQFAQSQQQEQQQPEG